MEEQEFVQQTILSSRILKNSLVTQESKDTAGKPWVLYEFSIQIISSKLKKIY